MLHELLMYFGMKAARKYEESTRLICSECGTDQQPEAKFCGKCGKRSLVLPSQYRKLEDTRRDASMKDLMHRQRRNLAIKRIHKLLAATACTNCNNYDENGSKFCTHCGTDISNTGLDDESIFEVVHAELPDACPSWDDFLGLKTATPEKGVIAGILGTGLAQVIRKHGIGSIE